MHPIFFDNSDNLMQLPLHPRLPANYPIITEYPVPGNLLTPRQNPIISVSRALFLSNHPPTNSFFLLLSFFFFFFAPFPLIFTDLCSPTRPCVARARRVTRVATERGWKKEKKKQRRDSPLTSLTALKAPPFRDGRACAVCAHFIDSS